MDITVNVLGIEEIEKVFKELPKKVSRPATWTKFWREISKPMVKTAQQKAPTADKNIPYPSQKSKTITKGTLKKSLGFFTTSRSRKRLGGYVGPRVKGRFKQEKGGYFGAWVEYGNEVMFFGKHLGDADPYMRNTWEVTNKTVLANGMKAAQKIFERQMKSYEKRMQKYGSLGY